LRIRDNTSTSVITTDPFNLAGYSSIEVEFFFRPVGMENGEDFWLQYNDGSGFETVATWVVDNVNISNNSFYTTTVTLSSADYSFVNGGTFRFRNDASVNNDRVYIDAVTITGITGSTNSTGMTYAPMVGMSTFVDGLDEEELALTLYPNPVKDLLHIQTDHAINKLLVYNTNGQLVISKEDAFEKINVSQLAKGLYLMQIYTEEGEVIQKKFLKE